MLYSRMMRIIKNCIKTTESVSQLDSHVNWTDYSLSLSHLTDGAAEPLLSSQGDVDPPLRTVQVRVLAGVGGGGLHGVRQLLVVAVRWPDPLPGDWLRPAQSDWEEAAALHLQLQPTAAQDESHGLAVCGRLHWQSTDLQQLVTRLQALGNNISMYLRAKDPRSLQPQTFKNISFSVLLKINPDIFL